MFKNKIKYSKVFFTTQEETLVHTKNHLHHYKHSLKKIHHFIQYILNETFLSTSARCKSIYWVRANIFEKCT